MATEPGLAQLLSHRHHLPLQHTATLSSPPRQGFGNVAREYWLGNEAVHRLTSRKAHLLRVELCDWEGHQTTIQYEHFQLGSEKQRYRWAWGPGLWVVRGSTASGCRVCTTGHSLGVSYFHHLAPIWAHVTGSGGGCLALSTCWPLGGVKRLSGTPPCPEQKGSSKVSQPTYRQQEWGLTSQSVPCGKGGRTRPSTAICSSEQNLGPAMSAFSGLLSGAEHKGMVQSSGSPAPPSVWFMVCDQEQQSALPRRLLCSGHSLALSSSL